MSLAHCSKIHTALQFIFFAVLAILFCAIISEDTSPLYDRSTGDTAMFYVIGKGWTQGILPYSGLFDQKGPIIYLINALGHLLTNTEKGVFWVQCVFMTFTFYVAYRFISLNCGQGWEIALFAVFLFSLIICYGGGNCVEEYLLPFLLASFYEIYRYFMGINEGHIKHPTKYAMLYGFTIAFCYLTRLTNALGLCVALLFIAIYIGKHHEWKNLWANVLACFLGFAIPVGISFIYFYSKGIFSQMWWATMTFAFGYLKHSGFQFARGLRDVCFFFIPMLNMIAVILLSIYNLFKSNSKYTSLCWIISALATFTWIIRGNGFSHYCMVALPFYFITILDVSKLQKNVTKKICFALYIAITVLAGSYRGMRIITDDSAHEELMKQRGDIVRIKSFTTKEEQESLCAFNCSGEFYIQSGIMPSFPFFMVQDSQSRDSPSYKYHIRNAFEHSNLKCIIVKDGIADEILYGMIRKKYDLKKKYKGLLGSYYIYTK